MKSSVLDLFARRRVGMEKEKSCRLGRAREDILIGLKVPTSPRFQQTDLSTFDNRKMNRFYVSIRSPVV